MDGAQYQYLRLNKCLMCIIGQWPYQSTMEKILISIVLVPIILGQTILQGGGMITALLYDDIGVAMEVFAPLIISFMCLVKYTNYIFNQEQMKNLLEVMRKDWNIYSRSDTEHEILHRNYAVGRSVAISYAVSLYGSMTPFMAVPTLLNIADAVGIFNMSGERTLMFRIDYFVDSDKHYYPLLIHSYFGTLAFITIVVGIDSMMIIYVQHECSICEILGYAGLYKTQRHQLKVNLITIPLNELFRKRLAEFVDGDDVDVDLYPDKQHDVPYENAKNCVILHNHIIQFATQLETANKTSCFFQLGFNMLGIIFTEFQAVVSLDRPNESLRYASFTVCLTSVLFLETWPGQQLEDYTECIFQYVTRGKWYRSSINARKLLHVMLLKSLTPIKLTAGGLYTLNFQNFRAVRLSLRLRDDSYLVMGLVPRRCVPMLVQEFLLDTKLYR